MELGQRRRARTLRKRHEAWIDRRSPRAAEIIRKAKKTRTKPSAHTRELNDNAMSPHEPASSEQPITASDQHYARSI